MQLDELSTFVVDKSATAPRILFVSCMPLEKPRTASMVFMNVLLERYHQQFIWFALRNPRERSNNPFDIPYMHAPQLRRLARFPMLRQFMRLTVWARYQGAQAAQFARLHGVEVVLADLAFEAVVAGRVAAELLRVPLLASVHDDPVNRIAVKDYPEWLVERFAREFAKTMRAARKCGVISPYMGEIYQAKYGVETTTLYVGVKEDSCLSPRRLEPQKTPLIIGSVGSFHCAENWQLLIDAVRRLNERLGADKFRILHIGKLADKLPVTDEVEVTGWLPEDEFLSQLNRIDLGFLNWSFDSAFEVTRRTSFPLKIHSYIQAQRPMLALSPPDSSTTRFVETFQCGVACSEQNVEQLASRLEEILCHTQRYAEALSEVKRLKKIFSRDKFFESFESFMCV